MKNWASKRRGTIIGIGLAVVALSAVAAFGVLQAISPTDAEQIALNQYPGATVSSTQLEDENGTSVYSVELQATSGDIEVNVDASSGTILTSESNDGSEADSGDADSDQIEYEQGEQEVGSSVIDNDQVENEQEGDYETED